ncbi:MAG: hypothetical protein V9G29_04420 [Burkholderiaceae bacterium]
MAVAPRGGDAVGVRDDDGQALAVDRERVAADREAGLAAGGHDHRGARQVGLVELAVGGLERLRGRALADRRGVGRRRALGVGEVADGLGALAIGAREGAAVLARAVLAPGLAARDEHHVGDGREHAEAHRLGDLGGVDADRALGDGLRGARGGRGDAGRAPLAGPARGRRSTTRRDGSSWTSEARGTRGIE